MSSNPSSIWVRQAETLSRCPTDNYSAVTQARQRLSSTDICCLLMGLAALVVFLLIWRGNAAAVTNITKEDALIENASALFWLQASIICFYRVATITQDHKLLLYFFGFFCLICCGEEISWGQRLFTYSLPGVQNISCQHEINLHNLSCFANPLGLYRALADGTNINWRGFLNPQNLFYLGFITFFFLIPLVMPRQRLTPLKEKFHYVAPSPYFLAGVWPPIILSFIGVSFSANYQGLIEAREMFMAFVVLFYVVFYLPTGRSGNPAGEGNIKTL